MEQCIGPKFKALRLQKGLSQNELCGNFMSRSTLSRIENSKIVPSIKQMIYLSKKLNVSISFFFNDINYHETANSPIIHSELELQHLFDNNKFYEVIEYYKYNHDKFSQIDNFNKYYYVGTSYYSIKMYRESIKLLRKYINKYERSENNVQKQNVINVGNALNTLCKIMINNHNFEKAKHYSYMAIKYLSKYEAFTSLIYFIVHNNLAYIFNNTFQYHKTINLIEGFLKANNNLSYRIITPQLHIAANVAYFNIKNYDKAIEHIKKSILLLSYEDDKQEIGRCYINYINNLRHSSKFTEAFEIVEYCKKEYVNYKYLYNKFLMQEITLYFNIKEYNKVLELSDKITFNHLHKMSRNNYNFMIGHINFLNKNYNDAFKLLIGCERYFIKRNYIYDLAVLYDNLYKITKDNMYKEKSSMYKHSIGRINIFIE